MWTIQYNVQPDTIIHFKGNNSPVKNYKKLQRFAAT